MPTYNYYVYAPFSGKLKGRDCYSGGSCGNGDCCQHTPVPECCVRADTTCDGCCANCGKHIAGASGAGICRAADIFSLKGSSGVDEVKLYVNENVQSIRTLYTGFCACTPPSTHPWVNHGVIVELYACPSATAYLIGKVLYGHLQTRTVNHNQVYNRPAINGLKIGTIGPNWCNCGACVNGICNCNTCGCACYPTSSNHHLHMGRTIGNNGTTRSWVCNTDVTTSYWMFSWQMTISNLNCPI